MTFQPHYHLVTASFPCTFPTAGIQGPRRYTRHKLHAHVLECVDCMMGNCTPLVRSSWRPTSGSLTPKHLTKRTHRLPQMTVIIFPHQPHQRNQILFRNHYIAILDFQETNVLVHVLCCYEKIQSHSKRIIL